MRERDLPAHVVVYYVIALALYMQSSYREVLRCLLEGVQWLLDPSATIKVAGKSGISQARTRLGWEAVRQLHDEVVKPIAVRATRGAWYRQWRLVSLDGSTLDVADEAANERPSAGPEPAVAAAPIRKSASSPWSRTARTCCSAARWRTMERVRSPWPKPCWRACSRACCAWRTGSFSAFELWNLARQTGADLLWRIKKNMRLACEQRLPDGSYLSHIYPSERDWRRKTNGVKVRVIDYCLDGVADAEPIYRLVTTILDHKKAPAAQLAALYHERWEIETALDELKTHLRGAKIVLRSKTPDLVRQEFYGLMMAHF